MSRYPGTQFKVYDNSQATAIVPVSNVNINDTVQYLTAFASVKGPEGITLTAGEDFYTRYGTQDNIDFKKYGQPLFQASMNINNGAALLAKRVVLDDATLGNATLAVVLTKYKDAKIEVDKDYSSLINSITFASDPDAVASKYSIAPMVFSIENSNNNAFASQPLNEYKERYGLYKNYIREVVANTDTPSNVFLNKLVEEGESKVLSGFAQSVYYDGDGNVIDFSKGKSKSDVRKVSSITTGIYSSKQKTYSSNFTVDDIIHNIEKTTKSVKNTDVIADAVIYKFTATKGNDDNYTVKSEIAEAKGTVTYKMIAQKIKSITRICTTEADLSNIINNNPEWKSKDYDNGNPEYAVVIPTAKTTGYPNVTRLLNDMMVEESGYISCEYVFPMFTIFDNGRGESIKSIGIEYDSASSVTLKKAVYSLSIYNYKTAKRLEKFAFSLNPYTRNNNTGYSFDIESAVNHVSKQISVETYYDVYDALLDTLQSILGTVDNDIITNNDILFGHTLNGKYPAYSSYTVSSYLNRNAYVYDYAHLDIFDNDIITINAVCDSDNMTMLEKDKIKYYYYNYTRQQQRLVERLENGTDGYCLNRTYDSTNTKARVPFIVIDDSDKVSDTSFALISDITGQPDGAVISADPSPDGTDIDICAGPVLEQNFYPVKLKLCTIKHYTINSNKFTVSEEQKTAKRAEYKAEYANLPENSEDKNKYATSDLYAEAKLKEYVNNSESDYLEDSKTYCTTYNTKTLAINNVFDASDNLEEIKKIGLKEFWKFTEKTPSVDMAKNGVTVYIPRTAKALYQEHYKRFFSGEYDKDIFNLDIYFPNAIFDANYSNSTKLAIQRLAAYRGDLMCYMDMGVGKIHSYSECLNMVPSTLGGLELTESDTNDYHYVRDMHIAITCLSYKIRNPYDNKIIEVSATYGLSNLYIAHFRDDVSKVFAGISNGVTIDNIIEGSVSYIPKIYPTSEMTSLNNIGGVYPSDDETIINEKQLMCDLRVNYGCYYDDRFSIETEYTMNATESEFSYWNNVALVCLMMQSLRKACPTARYQFITSEDLTVYQEAIETAMKPWRNKFASIKFKYVNDDAAIENKIFYAAIEVVFKPFAQAEIFELTALNYSTLSSNVTSI